MNVQEGWREPCCEVTDFGEVKSHRGFGEAKPVLKKVTG
jgi:hypothetical protein